jgi:glycosyltransferase involved in cell wall biosynthesis
MNPHPKVSVVMSVYNGAEHLDRALDSVLSQEGVDFEFLVVDDGSTDRTAEILVSRAVRDARLRIITQQNTGLTRALIAGCAAAQGVYIARQDADDRSLPGRLRRLSDLLDRSPDVLFASSTTQSVGPREEPLELVTRPEDSQTATRQLLEDRTGPSAHGSVMFRSSAYAEVGGYRPEFYYGQDSDLWMRMAQTGHVAYLPETLYVVRRSPESISSVERDVQRRYGEIARECLAARRRGEPETELLQDAERLAEESRSSRSNRPGRSRRKADVNYLIGSGLARQGDSRALGYFREAIKSNPLHLRAAVRLLAFSVKNSLCGTRNMTPDPKSPESPA